MSLWPFDNTIPFGTHNPSADQPIMLANNVSNQAIWNIDHIGFNANNGGWHNVIHFNNQIIPPFDPPVVPGTGQMYTKTISGDEELFYESGVDQGSGFGVITQLTGTPSVVVASVNFDGTQASPITSFRSSINVTKITRDSSNRYTLTFTDPLPNNNYVVVGTSRRLSTSANDSTPAIFEIVSGGLSGTNLYNTVVTDTGFTFVISNGAGGPGGYVTSDIINIMVFGG